MPSKIDFIVRVADLKRLYDGQKCPVCFKYMDVDLMCVAFRIPAIEGQIEEHGVSIIYHPVNYGLVCSPICAHSVTRNWFGKGLEQKLKDRAWDWDQKDRARREELKKAMAKKGNKFYRGDWKDQIRMKYGIDETLPQK